MHVPTEQLADSAARVVEARPRWLPANPAARRPGQRRSGPPKSTRHEPVFRTAAEVDLTLASCSPAIRDLVYTAAAAAAVAGAGERSRYLGLLMPRRQPELPCPRGVRAHPGTGRVGGLALLGGGHGRHARPAAVPRVRPVAIWVEREPAGRKYD